MFPWCLRGRFIATHVSSTSWLMTTFSWGLLFGNEALLMCVFFQVGAICNFCSSLASTNQYMTWGCHTIYRGVSHCIYWGLPKPWFTAGKESIKFKEGNQQMNLQHQCFWQGPMYSGIQKAFFSCFSNFFVLHPPAAKLAGRRKNFVQGIHGWTKWQACSKGNQATKKHLPCIYRYFVEGDRRSVPRIFCD